MKSRWSLSILLDGTNRDLTCSSSRETKSCGSLKMCDSARRLESQSWEGITVVASAGSNTAGSSFQFETR